MKALRMVPQDLWERVQGRLQGMRGSWPGGKGRRGFEGQRSSRVALYPTELLSGAMECGVCGAAIVKASGKAGGYYGCLGAAKGSCESRLLVRQTMAERIIIERVSQTLSESENLRYVFERVEAEVTKLLATAPESIRLKEAELEAVKRRVQNFVEFVAQGRGSKALAGALVVAEKNAEELEQELETLRRSQRPEVRMPPLAWVAERVATLQEVLERRTERSALLLRKLLGRIRLEPVRPDVGRPYFRAVSKLQPLALLEMDPSSDPEDGSNALRWGPVRKEFEPPLRCRSK